MSRRSQTTAAASTTPSSRSNRRSSSSSKIKQPAAPLSPGASASSSTRRRSGASTAKQPRKSSILHAPRIVQGEVEFPLGPVQEHLTCRLCKGYLRCALTISECLHSFCKSCLFCAYNGGVTKCPTCDVNLGPDPYSVTIYDRTLQELVDKVLPEMQEIEDLEERLYYERKGINPKPEFEKEIEREKKRARQSQSGQEDGDANDDDDRGQADVDADPGTFKKAVIPEDELDVELQPDQQDRKSGKKKSRKISQDKKALITLQPLKNSIIRTSGKLKISQLKKYIRDQLTLDPSQVLELRCNGDTVGDELSLTFIQRTRWLKPDEDMVLGYRLSQDRVTSLPKHS